MIQAVLCCILIMLLSSTAALVTPNRYSVFVEGSMTLSAAVGALVLTLLSETGSWFAVIISLLGSCFTGIIVTMVSTVWTKREDGLMKGIAINLAAIGAAVLTARFVSVRSGGTAFNFMALPQNNPWSVQIDSWHFNVFLPVGVLVLLVFYLPIGSRFKMRLRAAGDDEAAAASIGLTVRKTRIIAALLSGCLSGLGGLGMVLVQKSFSFWLAAMGCGFLSIAAVSCGDGRAKPALLKAALFGILYSIGFSSEANGLRSVIGLPSELLQGMPFIVCLIMLIIHDRQNAING